MPGSTRLLYYDLGMEADDDGFVQARMVMALSGAKEDDYRFLVAKGFLIEFNDKVVVIRDWKVNNEIRQDRYKQTFYKEHKNKLIENEQRQYTLIKQYENMVVPNDNRLDTQYRIGKDSIDNTYTSSTSLTVSASQSKVVSPDDTGFDVFWSLYPRKVEKKKAMQKWVKLPPQTRQIILDDIPKRKNTSQWQKGYIPHPTTYLNGERWNDELEEEKIIEIPKFKGFRVN